MEMYVLAWDRKHKTTDTDGNVGFGMEQETENDRDMEMYVLAWDRKQKTTEIDGNVGLGMGQEIENEHFHQSLSFSVSCPLPKRTFPSVSVVFCFLSHAKTYISISLCRFLFPVPCQNLYLD
jgi:hypothetical protein